LPSEAQSVERRSRSSNPIVSVLMPVYNDAPYIAEAMESILAQAGPDLEFVIVDDAGTDGSSAILRSFSDDRITLICQNVNRGLAASLNDGLRYCRGKYIARQDGDDVSEPGRFRKQVAYLDRNAGIAYVGTGVVVIDEKGNLPSKIYIKHGGSDYVLLTVFDSMVSRHDIYVKTNGHEPSIIYIKEVTPIPKPVPVINKSKLRLDY